MPQSLQSLPPDAFEALAKAALLDDPFPTQALLATGSPPEALDPLFDLELLEATSACEASFTSEPVRQSAISALSWSEKRKLSHALADACQSLAQDHALIARLYRDAHQHEAARRHFIKAAEKACQRHAYRDALALIQSAFEIWPVTEAPEERRRVLRELARCASNCSDHETARLVWTELLETAGPECDPTELIDLTRQSAQAAAAAGDPTHARELLADAAKIADNSGLPTESARLWRSLAQAQGDALRVREALGTIQTAASLAERLGDAALLSDSLAYQALLTAMLGRLTEAHQLLDKALAIAIEHDLADQITNAYRRQANVNEYAANYKAYRDTELAALDRCRNLGQLGGAQACLSCVSYAFFRLGQFEESLAAIDEAVDKLDAEGELRAGALAVRACIHAFRGSSVDTVALIDEAQRLTRIHNCPVFEFYLLWAKGSSAVLQGQPKIAHQAFAELIDFWGETDDRKDVVPGLVCAASFFAQESDYEKLATCVDILNTIQSASESAEPRFAFIATSAEDAWARGQAKVALSRLEEAIAGYHSLHLPFEEAWLRWRLAHIQSQTGSNGDALASWRKGEAIANKLGLKPLLRVIARDRRQTTAEAEEAPTLTPRQREIARLIAAGRTNKEAAAELGISPRTVEMHVAAIIERLGCRSRAEAAAKASAQGLLEG